MEINNSNYDDMLMDSIIEQQQNNKLLKRKCVDYHTPAVLDISSRLYYKTMRSRQTRLDTPYLQPHSSYIHLMGLPISRRSAPDPSSVYCTFMAHVTRAKNSSAVMCLRWTPGGQRLLTGNYDRKSHLTDHRVAQLDAMGFVWSKAPTLKLSLPAEDNSSSTTND